MSFQMPSFPFFDQAQDKLRRESSPSETDRGPRSARKLDFRLRGNELALWNSFRAALLGACIASSPVSVAYSQNEHFSPTVTVHMRDTGYVLGDFIEQRIELAAPAGAQLVRESIPAPGRINNWLELRESRVEGRTLVLTYQVFGAVESALQLAIPAFALRMREGESQTPLSVPAQPFYLSPVLPPVLGEQDRQPRTSLAPEPLPRRRLGLLALGCAAIAFALAIYLAWVYDRLPFFSRNAGPLTRCFRKLRRTAAAPLDGQAYRAQLEDLHTALNRCADETLYEASLPLLFARAPHLAPLRAEIESFFRHSREVFYGAGDTAFWPQAELLGLCRRARDCERGLR